MANMDRINQVFNRITDENLYMSRWAKKDGTDSPEDNPCGTSFCFAGHATVAGGKKLAWYPIYKMDEHWNDTDEIEGWDAAETTDGQAVEQFAKEWLELTWAQASHIFYATEIYTVDELRQHVDSVISRESLTELVKA